MWLNKERAKLILFLVACLFVVFYMVMNLNASAQEIIDKPAVDPTGCPYGDSIPIDSPKCVPPPPVIAQESEMVYLEGNWGK